LEELEEELISSDDEQYVPDAVISTETTSTGKKASQSAAAYPSKSTPQKAEIKATAKNSPDQPNLKKPSSKYSSNSITGQRAIGNTKKRKNPQPSRTFDKHLYYTENDHGRSFRCGNQGRLVHE